MSLTRTVTGLLLRDEFSSDTSANYSKTTGGSMTVGGGVATLATGWMACINTTVSGVKCVSLDSLDARVGPLINANAVITPATSWDGYYSRRTATTASLQEVLNGIAAPLAADATSPAYAKTRLYVHPTGLVLRYGATSLVNSLTSVDTTYSAGGYGGAGTSGDTNKTFDNLDLRTSHLVTVTSLPAGSSVVCSDGTTTANADTAAGTATVDCGAVLFPLASVTVYDGVGGTGNVLSTLTSATLADMGGGDTFAYAGAVTTHPYYYAMLYGG